MLMKFFNALPPPPPEFQSVIVNASGDGNDAFRIRHTRPVVNDGPAGALDGYTIDISIDGSSWSALDKTNMSTEFMGTDIKVTLGGNATKISSTHRLRIAYSSVSGDIVDAATSDALATFSATENTSNLSSINFTRGQSTTTGNRGDHYDLSEASGTRDPVQNTSVTAYDMSEVNTVTTRTHPSGSGNTLNMNENGWLQSTDGWADDDENPDTNSAGAWVLLDTLPSALNGGAGRDANIITRWSTDNSRAWQLVVWGRQDSSLDNVPQVTLHSESNTAFAQRDSSTTLSTGTWYYLGWTHDSSGSASAGSDCALKLYVQALAGGQTEISNALVGTTTDLTLKVNDSPVPASIGITPDLSSDVWDGGVAECFQSRVSLTAAEHAAIGEYPRPWPYFPDLA